MHVSCLSKQPSAHQPVQANGIGKRWHARARGWAGWNTWSEAKRTAAHLAVALGVGRVARPRDDVQALAHVKDHGVEARRGRRRRGRQRGRRRRRLPAAALRRRAEAPVGVAVRRVDEQVPVVAKRAAHELEPVVARDADVLARDAVARPVVDAEHARGVRVVGARVLQAAGVPADGKLAVDRYVAVVGLVDPVGRLRLRRDGRWAGRHHEPRGGDGERR